MTEGATALFETVDRTWPAKAYHNVGPWTLREGYGGGQRVSCATTTQEVTADDILVAAQAMRDLGQSALFCVRGGQEALDALLAEHGYMVRDPVVLYRGRTSELGAPPIPAVSAFALWPRLAIVEDLWRDAGLAPKRLEIMDRAQGPKTCILAREDDRAAGVAFVACHGKNAMIHAIEVLPRLRRRGSGTNIVRRAAKWAQDQGADTLLLAVTRSNHAANTLYSSLGMHVCGYYHYRTEQNK
ncbi:MAG: GNAT family N-acetyltransferase [Pseudomonadota bacterium]